jgi:hypothetical protein
LAVDEPSRAVFEPTVLLPDAPERSDRIDFRAASRARPYRPVRRPHGGLLRSARDVLITGAP